ncbi:hypothetical protein GTA62_20555 [Roseobacter sp. HKCCD9010]|uniref:hypothetical protein n=1 Tax=unclassified Roseobacter TaxID=196798 RepID=UPI0014917DA1|nr:MULTISPECIES: hypothetical protein [unclassified Roseobacter]MBF9052387.1 hypothetical protein [Rhodobacterales bacterium HKCCD4356]NNV40853.1 hypothetical protein [Roseobacter sp. HKCCD9054]NNV79161.1 hypothetical protein [Roseobacter sp. HKCCD6135]NNW08936.1 hypothetical protein [Roseobacter sp. HKCCD8431]NNW26014.1 hypothetical protein [Roseobacter sp. HKCCD5929]NNW34457.1 hypothetical protein [Roseobacter sp. HKCCD8198]NNW51560.1 hypothetical protein [Roseobacter sp. HKCCD9144]NNW558
MSIEDIKDIYSDLSAINRKFGEDVIATLHRNPETTDEEWENYKAFLLQDAFCLTVSITGDRDQQLYGESSDVFESAALPNPIRTVYFNNITAWQRHASRTEPRNRLEVFLDFGKPPLFDPTSVLSEPTPNDSSVKVKADDMTFFRAVRQIVDTKLLTRRTWYSSIHRSFTYDAGVWLVALPAGLIVATFYMETWFPVGSNWEAYRWAFFLYALGLVLLGYRFVSDYAKWAFPVNVLSDNKDNSLRHRLTLGGLFGWLFYKAADAVYGLLPFTP